MTGPDIVDIKPANMEDLTEVITASEFHPHHCNLFVYSSSKGSLRLCDMRAAALCDKHAKRECAWPAPGASWAGEGWRELSRACAGGWGRGRGRSPAGVPCRSPGGPQGGAPG